MIFSVVVQVSTSKGGLALLDEYRRLSFPWVHCPSSFRPQGIRVEVPFAVAREYPQLFGNSHFVKAPIDLSETEAEDWTPSGRGLSLALNPAEITVERAIAWALEATRKSERESVAYKPTACPQPAPEEES